MTALTYKQRQRLPKKSFVFSKKAPESGSYPIDTINRARNALARVAQHGTPSEQAAVRAAVYKKYPELKKRKSMREHRQAAKGK